MQRTLSGKQIDHRFLRMGADAALGQLGAEWESAKKILRTRLPQHVDNAERFRSFLNPDEILSLPEFFELNDMSDACDAVLRAADAGKKIGVYGDYDADGNTSSAIVGHAITDITGTAPEYYIPHRREGYGLNKTAIKKLHDKGVQMLVVVDCGTTSAAEIDYAKSLGMAAVILDHHRPKATDRLPDCPLVNPSRLDEDYPHKSICAAGLAYIFARDLNIRLRQTERYSEAYALEKGPLLVAAAIGTVTDVMKLDNPVNRYLVKAGLKEINSGEYPGIEALKNIYGLRHVGAEEIGFLIGPAFNAAGRIATPDLARRLLTTHDAEEAIALAKQLVAYNDVRKQLSNYEIYKEAENKAETYLARNPNARYLMVEDAHWDKGVVGVVASRLKERFNLPVAVGNIHTNAEGKSITTYSIRSIPGVDFFARALSPLLEGKEPGLIGGGGHADAAGMSIETEAKDQILTKMQQGLRSSVQQTHKQERLYYDAEMKLEELTLPMLHQVKSVLEPTGKEFDPVRILLRGVQVKSLLHAGRDGEHYRVALGYPGRSDILLPGGITYRAQGTALGNALASDNRASEQMDVIVEPFVQLHGGKTKLGYRVVDATPPHKTKLPPQKQKSRLDSLLDDVRRKAEASEAHARMRTLAALDDVSDKIAQDALKTLHENNISILDTETTGLRAGRADNTNAITQMAAIKVKKNKNGTYELERKVWFFSPHRPAYFSYERALAAGQNPAYSMARNEYAIDNGALGVTSTSFKREHPTGPITAMEVGGEAIPTRPFYEQATDILTFLGNTTPYAYNMPFDGPVLTRHFDQALNATNFPNPEDAAAYEKEIAAPLRKKMAAQAKMLEKLENPAYFHCALFGALVHQGEGKQNRLPNMCERYGIEFSRDDSKHDALEDILPLAYMIADQVKHFGQSANFAHLWQHLADNAHPALKAREYTHIFPPKSRNHEEEKVSGHIRLSYSEQLANEPSLKNFIHYLQGFHEVKFFNNETNSMILSQGKDDDIVEVLARNRLGRVLDFTTHGNPDQQITLLNKRGLDRSTTQHFRLIKNTVLYQRLMQHPSIVSAAPYDSTGKLDIVIRNADGSTQQIDSVPIGSLRRSAPFILQDAQQYQLGDYLQALQFLDRLKFAGIATITEQGIEVRGVQRQFGDLTIEAPKNASIADFLKFNTEQLESLMQMAGIPQVRDTHISDDELEEEREQAPEALQNALGIQTRVRFSPNPQVEMEVSNSVLQLISKHLTPPVQFTHGTTILSGIQCQSAPDAHATRLSGNLEAFKEISGSLRNAAWLLYRFQTLPNVRPDQTALHGEKLTLFCTPMPRVEDVWILERAHVPYQISRDRIEIDLGPLMHDPYHWYSEVSKELRFVKDNAKRVRDVAYPPEGLKDLISALEDGRIEAYHNNRMHNTWVRLGGMQHVRVDTKDGELHWPVSNLKQQGTRPATVAGIPANTKPDLAQLLRECTGHTQPIESVYKEQSDGRILLRAPDYQQAFKHFPLLATEYKALAAKAISVHINPLLDAMREIADDPALNLPHTTPLAEKNAHSTRLFNKFAALEPLLQACTDEATDILNFYRASDTQEPAFQEVARLEHLLKELDTQCTAHPKDTALQNIMQNVRTYFERISLAEFKQYRVATDLQQDAIPALHKAADYLKKYRDSMQLASNDDAAAHNRYLELKRAFDKTWEGAKKLQRTLYFSQEIVATAVALENHKQKGQLHAACNKINRGTHGNLLRKVQYLQHHGGVDTLEKTEEGVLFQPSNALLENPDHFAQLLATLPQVQSTERADKRHFLLIDTSAFLTMLTGLPAAPGSEDIGLLHLLHPLQRHGALTPVFTGATLAEIFNSPVPLSPQDIFRFDEHGKAGEVIYPEAFRYHQRANGEIHSYPQWQERFTYLRDALNNGARFYETSVEKSYMKHLKEHPRLRASWRKCFPDASPLSQQDDATIKQKLLTPSDEQQLFTTRLRKLHLRADIGELSLAQAAQRLHYDYPESFPVVLYQQDEVRARILQQANAVDQSKYQGGKSPLRAMFNHKSPSFKRNTLEALGNGAFLSVRELKEHLAKKAHSYGGFLIYTDEAEDLDGAFNRVIRERADKLGHNPYFKPYYKKVAQYFGDYGQPERERAWDAIPRLMDKVPDTGWLESFILHAERLQAGTKEESRKTTEQMSHTNQNMHRIHQMKDHLKRQQDQKPAEHETAVNDASTVDMSRHVVDRIFRAMMLTPTMASSMVAAIPAQQHTALIKALDQRAERLQLPAEQWQTVKSEIWQNLSSPQPYHLHY